MYKATLYLHIWQYHAVMYHYFKLWEINVSNVKESTNYYYKQKHSRFLFI